MRHRKKKATLSRTAAARRVLARKLAVSFVLRGRVETTPARARFLQMFIEPLVTRAKPGDLASRRRALQALGDRAAAAKLVARAEGYRTRAGGYTRVSKLPYRKAGDGSPRVHLEFV